MYLTFSCVCATHSLSVTLYLYSGSISFFLRLRVHLSLRPSRCCCCCMHLSFVPCSWCSGVLPVFQYHKFSFAGECVRCIWLFCIFDAFSFLPCYFQLSLQTIQWVSPFLSLSLLFFLSFVVFVVPVLLFGDCCSDRKLEMMRMLIGHTVQSSKQPWFVCVCVRAHTAP